MLFLKMTYYCIIYSHTLKFYKYYINGYITIRFLIHLINSYHIFIEKKENLKTYKIIFNFKVKAISLFVIYSCILWKYDFRLTYYFSNYYLSFYDIGKHITLHYSHSNAFLIKLGIYRKLSINCITQFNIKLFCIGLCYQKFHI